MEPRLRPPVFPCARYTEKRRRHRGYQKASKVGRSDRYPSDYGVRDRDDAEKRRTKNKSWDHGDKGQGRDGLSKGYGGSEGEGTGPSGPSKRSDSAFFSPTSRSSVSWTDNSGSSPGALHSSGSEHRWSHPSDGQHRRCQLDPRRLYLRLPEEVTGNLCPSLIKRLAHGLDDFRLIRCAVNQASGFHCGPPVGPGTRTPLRG